MSNKMKLGTGDSAQLVTDIEDAGPQTFSYNEDGTLAYTEVAFNGSTYRQTISYLSGRVSAISSWVKQ